MRILKLTLNRIPFDVMVTGEKTEEFRNPGKWIESRLFNKDGSPRTYDRIQYTNGYGASRPRFITDYDGFELLKSGTRRAYSNGLEINADEPVFVIRHTKIISSENL